MRNENFTLQNSLEANYLNVSLQEPIEMDEIAVNVVKRDCPEFLIPFRIVNINDSVSLKYKLINTVALEYSNMTLHKPEFIKLYQNLLTPFIKGNDWFLDYHNFCIDARYIFLDKNLSAAHFIYIPEKSYRNTDEEIFQFFNDIFSRVTIVDDAAFQVRLFQYFARKDATLADLYELIQKEGRLAGDAGKSSTADRVTQEYYEDMPFNYKESLARQKNSEKLKVETPEGEDAAHEKDSEGEEIPEKKKSRGILFGVNGKEKGRNKKKNFFSNQEEKTEDSSSEDSDEVINVLFGENKKKEKNKKKDKNKKKVEKEKYKIGQEPESGAVQSSPDNYPKGTEEFTETKPTRAVYGEDMEDVTEISSEIFDRIAYLELISSPISGAMTTIELNFDTTYITIGRISSDEVQPDVAFSRDFTWIGRRHARIEKREGNYYVIDLGSANHTLLNGQVLVPNQPYQLQDGEELAFAEAKPVRYRIHL